MADESCDKATVTYHRRLFRINVMTFGLSTAPAVFADLINVVLGLEDCAMDYFKNPRIKHIQVVFERLRKHKLKLKLKKCNFFKKERK